MRLGFIGIGNMARHHARAAQACGAEIRAACSARNDSPNWQAWYLAYPRCRFEKSIEAVLDAGADALVAAPSWRELIALTPRLLSLDVPVLLEKPIAMTAGAPPSPSDKRVGFNRRHYQSVNVLRGQVQTQPLLSAHVVVSEHIGHHVATSGSDIIAHLLRYTSIHVFDLVEYIFGDPEVVSITARDMGNGFVCYNGLLRTTGGVPIHLSVNADDPGPIGIWCRFASGEHFALSPLERLSIYYGVEIEPPRSDYPLRQFRPANEHSIVTDVTHKPGILEQMDRFITGEYDALASVEDHNRAIRLIERIEHAGSISPAPA